MCSIAILRPTSPFAGVVEDDARRPWVLRVATSNLRDHVYVHASSGTAWFGGDLHIPRRCFDDLTQGHGQSAAFIRRIAAHMYEVARQRHALSLVA